MRGDTPVSSEQRSYIQHRSAAVLVCQKKREHSTAKQVQTQSEPRDMLLHKQTDRTLPPGKRQGLMQSWKQESIPDAAAATATSTCA